MNTAITSSSPLAGASELPRSNAFTRTLAATVRYLTLIAEAVSEARAMQRAEYRRTGTSYS